jgi:hypothetical protein
MIVDMRAHFDMPWYCVAVRLFFGYVRMEDFGENLPGALFSLLHVFGS